MRRRWPGSRRRTVKRPTCPSTPAWPGPAWTWAACLRSAWPCRTPGRWSGRRCRSTCRWRGGTSRAPARRCLVHVREQSGVLHLRHCGGVLGQEHVGRGGGAFLDDLVGQLGVRSLAHGDLDAGLRREGVDPFLGQAFVLGVVDRQAATDRLGARGRRRDRRRTRWRGCRGARRRRAGPADVHADAIRAVATRRLAGRGIRAQGRCSMRCPISCSVRMKREGHLYTATQGTLSITTRSPNTTVQAPAGPKAVIGSTAVSSAGVRP